MDLSDAPPPPPRLASPPSPQRHGEVVDGAERLSKSNLRPTSPSEKAAGSVAQSETELPSWSPRDSRHSTEAIDGNDTSGSYDAVARPPQAHVEYEDEDDDEFHDIALDASVGVVPKSIFKEKKGFLTRLMRDASSSVRGKYAPSESHTVLPAGVPDAPSTPQHPILNGYTDEEAEALQRAIDETKPNVEIVLDEEEPIDVAIEQTTPLQSLGGHGTSVRAVNQQRAFKEEEEDDRHDIAPQVVIHSTESDSDSGFATLNPIINRHSSLGKRSGSFAVASGPGLTVNPPVLVSLPISEEATESTDRMALVINALGATGLSKVEKFGTQSTLLEMRVCESTEQLSSGATHLSYLRTAVHKKGGTEAQWNQQFTATLRSKIKQSLHVSVRTHSKLLVGQAKISLADVKESLYDRHFTIYKPGNDGVRESAGQVHLQLRIVDATELAPQMPATLPARVTTSMIPEAERARLIPASLRNGALMFKVPFHTHALMGSAASKRQWIAIAGDGIKESVSITWCDPIDTTEKSRRLEIGLITEIREGARTKAFERLLQNEPSSVARESERCFSIISKTRTLDLVASSKEEAQIWIDGLRKLVSPSDNEEFIASEPSAKTIQDFRHSAMTTRDATTLGAMSTTSKKQQLSQWRSVVFEYARQSQISAVSACLHDGCPIDLLETGSGDTLLMLACRLGDARLVELCLQWRAKNDPHPEFGETALQVAVNAGYSECLDLILRTAAKSDMDSEIVNHIDSNNDAPLHVAARKGDLACIQLLLHHGADVCVVEEFGRTPLHCATLSGSLDCVAYLLDVGGDSVLNAGDHDGDTALHYAALAGRDNIVRLLLESAANVDSTNTHGETPYDLAVRENHEDCVALIATYYHSTAQEESTPSTRNDTASSLLRMQHKYDHVEYDQATEGMDDVEDDDVAEEDPEAYIEPSNSPVRRGPIRPSYAYDNDDYYEEEQYESPRSSRRGIPPDRHHTQPISPSARVREVLATHRERRSMTRGPPVPPLQFHSARDDIHSRFMLVPTHDLPVRHAYTDRIDRDMLQYRRDPYAQYPSHYGYEHPSHQYDLNGYHRPDPYMGLHDRGHGSSPQSSRGRSMSAQASPGYHHPEDPYGQGYGQYHESAHPSYGRRSNSADMSYYHASGAWQDPHQPPVQSVQSIAHPVQPLPPAQPIQDPVDVWDTYYSEEGYPYYVNRATGVSQWENPNEQPALTSPASTPAAVAPLGMAGSSLTHTTLEAATSSSTPTETRESRSRNTSDDAVAVTEEPTESREPILTRLNSHEEPTKLPTLSIAKSKQDDLPSPCASPTSSKYEARTGLRLSVDIACAPRQDETRPVYVPSPRARSPRKTTGDGDSGESGFEKSTRPSSPRGKTKNVQLIELKRANNLAMALASFKIIDRNDQIVHGIASLDEKVVNAELLVCLQRFFPTEDEAAQLQAYQGPVKSLGKAERFFFQLLQIPDVVQRIDCFLYKLQFARNYRSVYSKLQVVKRACRDLMDNFSFIEALDEFFKRMKSKSLQVFISDKYLFQTEYLPRVDGKLHSFREDFQKAAEIELLDVQLQINRLLTGIRPIQAFVEKMPSAGDHDTAAHDILQRFLAETRGKLADLEAEYEVLGQWEDKVLGLFGESKASCQLAPILECLCAVLEKEYGFIL